MNDDAQKAILAFRFEWEARYAGVVESVPGRAAARKKPDPSSRPARGRPPSESEVIIATRLRRLATARQWKQADILEALHTKTQLRMSQSRLSRIMNRTRGLRSEGAPISLDESAALATIFGSPKPHLDELSEEEFKTLAATEADRVEAPKLFDEAAAALANWLEICTRLPPESQPPIEALQAEARYRIKQRSATPGRRGPESRSIDGWQRTSDDSPWEPIPRF